MDEVCVPEVSLPGLLGGYTLCWATRRDWFQGRGYLKCRHSRVAINEVCVPEVSPRSGSDVARDEVCVPEVVLDWNQCF
jgi:hypothetical protein